MIKKLDSQLQNYIESNNSKMDELGKKLDFLIERTIPTQEGILLGSGPRDNFQLDVSGGRSHRGDHYKVNRNQRSNHHARFEFPFFDEVDPCSWLRKGERYFHYNQIHDQDEKLEIAVLHLTGKAES